LLFFFSFLLQFLIVLHWSFWDSFLQLYKSYEERVIPLTQKMGKFSVVYADPMLRGITLPRDAVVQVWALDGAAELIKLAASRGHQLILSAGWYLDMQVN
jgi:hypothetical protein